MSDEQTEKRKDLNESAITFSCEYNRMQNMSKEAWRGEDVGSQKILRQLRKANFLFQRFPVK
jgi:hypothetical protein